MQQKNKIAGRPVKVVKKEIRAAVRFTKAEYFIIRQKANKAGISASCYIREIAIHGNVKSRFNEEERQFVRQLIGMANNFNQVAKKAHEEGLLKAMLLFERYRQQVDDILKSFKK